MAVLTQYHITSNLLSLPSCGILCNYRTFQLKNHRNQNKPTSHLLSYHSLTQIQGPKPSFSIRIPFPHNLQKQQHSNPKRKLGYLIAGSGYETSA